MREFVQRRAVRRQAVRMLGLAPVFALVHYAAYLLRFDGALPLAQAEVFARTILLVVVIKCFTFAWFRIFQAWGRHVTFHDLVMLVQATTVSSLLTAVADYLLLPAHAIPRSVFLMDWGATLLIVGGLRGMLRSWHEGKHRWFWSSRHVPVLIVGANHSGEALLRALRLTDALPYRVVGFITAEPEHVATCIAGVPVLGTIDQTCRLAAGEGISEVLIAGGDLTGWKVRRLVEDGRDAGIHVRVLPSYEELINGKLSLQPRPVSIEDLLRREPVSLEMDDIRQWIDGRVVMVTGSAGSIGSEICRQLLRFSPSKLVLVDRWENGQFALGRELATTGSGVEIDLCIGDISDEPRMRRLFQQRRPEIVFHAAAYKHVPLMEAHPGEAVKNTTLATARLADLAEEFGVGSLVMISSDKAVNPTSVMGACKRAAELYIQSLAEGSACRFVTVRFGNVLDSTGSVVPIFREQIARGGPVTVTDPRMQRYFMTIPEAAQLVIQAGTIGQRGEILVLDMGEPVRIVDLAADMIRLSGLRVGADIEIQFTGLRPGEKLCEELHVRGEKHLPTRHPKILIAEGLRQDRRKIAAGIARLAALADDAPLLLLAELKRLVPEFLPEPDLPAERRRAA